MKKEGKNEIKTLTIRRILLSTLYPLLLTLLFALSANGATLSEYRGKIEKARGLADELIYGNVPNQTNENLVSLRRELPESEKVEWRGNIVETDNKWFQERLDEFEKETDASKRKLILLGVRERLSAIKQKLDELENPSASNRSKDEDKRKLSEILKREEYQKPPEKEESPFQRIMKKIREWFKSDEKEDAPQTPSGILNGLGAIGQFLQIALYVLIFAALGFLVYKLLPFVEGKFRNREKREKKERVILGERIAAGESSENLFSEAENLARHGNLRGAIRKGYIALLCELSDRKIIGLAQHKTNRDYLRDVRKRKELHANMSNLTNNFERHWYGFDEVELKDWEEFRQGYRKAVSNGQ